MCNNVFSENCSKIRRMYSSKTWCFLAYCRLKYAEFHVKEHLWNVVYVKLTYLIFIWLAKAYPFRIRGCRPSCNWIFNHLFQLFLLWFNTWQSGKNLTAVSHWPALSLCKSQELKSFDQKLASLKIVCSANAETYTMPSHRYRSWKEIKLYFEFPMHRSALNMMEK